MSSQDFCSSLLGKPWRAGAAGPDAYDCWGLVCAVQREVFDKDLPMLSDPPTQVMALARLFRDTSVRDLLIPIDGPKHGAVVELSHSSRPHHVGVWLDIDRGGVLHSYGPYGVQFDRLPTLRAAGWNTFKYYDIH